MKITEQFLSGTSLTNWCRLLWENRLRVGWRYLPRALYVTLAALVMLPFSLYERIRFSRKIRRTRIERPPLFILGHWRSGTTYLHVLMAQDRNLAYASNLQAILPQVFLGSAKVFAGSVRRFLPEKRWMDDFRLTPHLPSEEEFAIANLCPYSMYHSLPFPQNRHHYARYCTMEGVPEHIIDEWKAVLLSLLRKLTYAAQGRRLLLKNPTHTARVRHLLELFPEAKFVHIYRNPYDVFASTANMYDKMFPSFYLQDPGVDPKEYILDIYARMFDSYFRDKDLIPAGNLVEVRYEDFVRDPLTQLERIYAALSLSGFQEARGAFVSYIEAQSEFRPNEHELSEGLRQEVNVRWRTTLERWGYLGGASTRATHGRYKGKTPSAY